ncbi:mechanosensitive ion channel family protein (plasmid) [Pontibacillus sp. ALD_SL1]|uniref:mechanosensitive ion channel family protein n=1 Tax=Pontibacillus sp. ALD_SL1 TaxID=2777185 RepID=UPI001A96213D|nr:mechanosensitive ion channel family protein [Pontibacillus sp. ALD_SL1]QST02840.1 mechanosensitive ion channel family protein [Pontibacillus sp. ALD_SL1]
MSDTISFLRDAYGVFSETNLFKLFVASLLAFLVVKITIGGVKRFFKRTHIFEERKEKTIESMVDSLMKFSAFSGLLFYGLSLYIEDFSKLLAGAGVIGIVLGFGAQSVIKDLLSGLFFLYEKQLHKGDFVKINGAYTGTVEEIGFRVLKIREWSGKLLSISNGSIKEIQNYNMDKMRVIEGVTTSFYQDPDEVIESLESACDDLNKQLSHLLLRDVSDNEVEPFQLYGMTSLNENHHGYEYTVVALVKDSGYFEAAKETRRVIARHLYKGGIKMAEENKYYRTRLEKQK